MAATAMPQVYSRNGTCEGSGMDPRRCDIAYVGTALRRLAASDQRRHRAGDRRSGALERCSASASRSSAPAGPTPAFTPTAQVAHVDLGRPFPARAWSTAPTITCRADIRVVAAGVAPEGFHPAARPRPRIYSYRLRPGRFAPAGPSAFRPRGCRSARLSNAFTRPRSRLPGRHDFSCLRPRRRQPPARPIRTLFRAAWEREGAGVSCASRGDGFLRGMVRGLVGTLLEVAPRTAHARRLRGAARGRRARRRRTDRARARRSLWSESTTASAEHTGARARRPCAVVARIECPNLARPSPARRKPSSSRRIDRSRLPRHVAVIMDGNGRWAGKRLMPRVEGHRAGVQAVRDTVESAARLGVEVT